MASKKQKSAGVMMPFSPAYLMDNWMQFGLASSQMWFAATEVVFRRMMRMSLGLMSASEATRMFTEKVTTFSVAGEQAAKAVAHGATPAQVAVAAVKPVHAKTRSNVRKLRR